MEADRPRVPDEPDITDQLRAFEQNRVDVGDQYGAEVLYHARTALEAARRERDDIEKAMQKQAVAYWSTPAGKRCIELGAEADRFRDRADAAEAKLAAVEAENARKQRTNLELVELTKDLENQRDEARAALQELWNSHNSDLYIGARLTKRVEDALSTSREPSPPEPAK